jgi:putative CocE/NonD family hydrolase
VHDYAALTSRPDIAVFETTPFKSAVDVIGPVVAELSVGSKLPDFDVWVQVYDVAPEGQTWNLTTAGSGLQRASYRDGGPDRKPLQPGQIVSLRLDRLFTANRFLPGHRLRIVVSTAFTPWFSVNPQTGELELFSSGARAGDVVIQH